MKRIGVCVTGLFMLTILAGCGGGDPQYAAKAPAVSPIPDSKPAAEPAGKLTDRKIRYSANVEIVVKSLDQTQDAVETLVRSKGGYVAKSELTGHVGDKRSGSWTIKIPAEVFREVVTALVRMGTLVRNSSDSEDFTEDYLDLEARLRNLKAEEDALNKLMKDSTRLDDVLKMREQVARNRGEIERAEGRLKYLASITSFSTITLVVREIKDYVPPTEPTFSSDLSETFASSTDALSRFAKGIALILTALAPWLPLVLIIGIAGRILIRRMIASDTQPILVAKAVVVKSNEPLIEPEE